MRPGPLPLSFLPLSLCLLATARLHHSLVPEDPYAFPKYRVTFLNGLPVLNETAQRWLQEGLDGGELEFLEQPWRETEWRAPPLKGIEGGEEGEAAAIPDSASLQEANFTLQRMKLGPRISYLCLIPPPPEEPLLAQADESQADVTPVHSWSLLQPLSGTCLYHKQGWFTYSYCHNSHVRQFHELIQQHAHRPGEYKPEEDTEWEAYTLGRAPPSLDAGADLTTAQEAAIAANLELARNAGSRYLVQRWGDGTVCDKTGKKREIEVQFHCSMTMTDTILFVKETQTCHYVLHIATPRLCGEPGFQSRLDAREEAFIRCREILDAEEYDSVDRSLPPAAHPFKLPKRTKPVIAPPPADPVAAPDAELKTPEELLRKALERFLARGGGQSDPQIVVEHFDGGDGEVYIEFIDADFPLEGDEGEGGEDGQPLTLRGDGDTLADILRAAGYDITGEKGKGASNTKSTESTEETDDGEDTKAPLTQRRDEL